MLARVPLAILASTLVACGPSEPPKAPASDGPSVAEPKACTQEAKLCPDGSAVSRTGPSCEFAPCPEVGGGAPPEGGVMCAADVKECPDGSTVSRAGPSCAFAPCPGADTPK
ncbi:MAG: hypothetical protein KF850_40810 [Labilithrix sp.]|nr:hypothetical protein [Labilithrix sp.]